MERTTKGHQIYQKIKWEKRTKLLKGPALSGALGKRGGIRIKDR